MTVTQQGQLDETQRALLTRAMEEIAAADEARNEARSLVRQVLETSSYRVVSEFTGLSTTTLQRWVKEA